MHNIKILHKNKSLFLFHINACSCNKIFDDLQHLLSSTKNVFGIIAISEKRITKQVSLLNNFNLKGNMQFIFLCNPLKSLRVIMFVSWKY